MDVVRIPSNVGYFRNLLQNRISSTLLEDHRTSLRDTPFDGYLDVHNIPIRPVLMDCLLEVFDVEKNSFKIGGKWTSFSVQDIARITGLPMGGSIVDTRFHRSDRETIYKLVLSFSSLDCGVFLMSYVFSLVSGQAISIDKKDCARHRARIVALFLSEGYKQSSQAHFPGC
ncbi:uncharacterized protein A4U43_C06F13220 [Asparagus officinalis]|uniref:Ubiquitin-like protease family profile domain-containing protein n=1 Tax=Asparagus officinalis TaxID=4686 RepID=A0A5P1ELL6_ASPOF|nr:uncharacterized protein A4U43_C06F13220 [Asparagus officinalis]